MNNYGRFDVNLRLATLFAVISVALYVVLGGIFLPSERDDKHLFCDFYDSSWKYISEDGTEKEVQLPGQIETKSNELTIYQNLPTDIKEGSYLIFRTAKLDYKVYVGNVLRKEYSTKNSRLIGNISTTYYLFVPISPFDAGKQIRVETTGDLQYIGDFHFIYHANYGGFWMAMIKEQGRIVVIGIVMITFAAIALVLSLAFQAIYRREQKLASLSLGVILVSIWIFANSGFRQIIFDNVSVIGDLTFFMVMLMPLPYADYMKLLQDRRYKKIYYAIEVLGLIDFVVCTAIYALGIKDFAEMFICMALVMFATILSIIGTMIADIVNGRIKDYWISACAIAIAMVIAVIEVLNYMNMDKAFDISIATIGLGLMLVVAVVDTLKDMMMLQEERNTAVLASETKSQFLANMSHEIRTPINAVLGMNEMILRESTEEQILSYARDVDNSGHTLLSLINDILDFSKIESGKFEIVEHDYDLKELLDKTLKLVRKRADEKELDLRVVVNPLVPRYLIGDENRFQQVMANLLTNAIKYTDKGFVELKVDYEKLQNECVKLYVFVTDSGRGIKEEDIGELFSSFNRVDVTNNRNIEGTGLGLAITKRIVELMNGEVGVESKYGEGSCFWIQLSQKIKDDVPIADYKLQGEESEKVELSKKEYGNIVAKGVRILAVDDVPLNLKVLAGFLKKSMIEIDMCTSAAEALDAFRETKYDLIILDHMMPIMDGVECAKIMLREKGINENVPIIMLTANAISGVREQYMDCGFADYLSKPYTQDQLNEVLCKHLPEGSYVMESEQYGHA